jgi:pilus assembly protein Flp/PilA
LSGEVKVLVGFLRDERGATAIEYALIAGLISVAVIAAVQALGVALGENYNETAAQVAATVP